MGLSDLSRVGYCDRAIVRVRPRWVMVVSFGLYAAIGCVASAFGQVSYEGDPINYSHAPVNNAIALLAKQLEDGNVTLIRDPKYGYLPSVLERLGVPVASQVLVFSKTSLQIQRISPSSPRAVYFNDDVYVGYVCDGQMLELSVADAKQGAVFYTLDQRYSEQPRFVRKSDECLSCHSSARTRGVPGHLMRSVAVDASGFPLLQRGSYDTTHNSPLSERWGGWYVTGEDSGQTHLGNAIATATPIKAKGDMEDTIDTSAYLTPTSDIVSLMVLAHQAHMHNLITRAGYESRITAAYDQSIRGPRDESAGSETETTKRRLDQAADELVRYMLFLDEPAIDEPIIGTSPFAVEFPKAGPHDRRGRSLRDLDLNRRLFKYPCSYLIYSQAFDALPDAIKSRVYRQLWEILTAKNRNIDYAMTARDRRNVLEILRDTKRDLPDYWKAE